MERDFERDDRMVQNAFLQTIDRNTSYTEQRLIGIAGTLTRIERLLFYISAIAAVDVAAHLVWR